MKKFIDLIISYKFSLIYSLFELIHILLGYKGNSYYIRRNKKSLNNSCPYYFFTRYSILLRMRILSHLLTWDVVMAELIFF